jgi:hypothetical protein
MIAPYILFSDRSISYSSISSTSDSRTTANRWSWSESRKGSTYKAKPGTGKKAQFISYSISRTGTKVTSKSHI